MEFHDTVPRLANNEGWATISVGSRSIMCMGVLPPHDHPHVFLDMGGETEVQCPYCSTLYRYSDEVNAFESKPEGCVVEE